MITTELYNGQGPGDQTWVYLLTRYLAKVLGYSFGIGHPERWKLSNLSLDFGEEVLGGVSPEGGPPKELPQSITKYYKEEQVYHKDFVDCNISPLDKKLFSLDDNTKIEGGFHYGSVVSKEDELFKEWLGLDEIEKKNPVIPGKVICNIRGGEYRNVPDLILPKRYWDMCLDRLGNPKVEIVTDDPEYALSLVPEGELFLGNILESYERLFTAETLVISNSTFGYFPAALGPSKTVLAPKYWNRWNVSTGFWSCGDEKCDKFTYIER